MYIFLLFFLLISIYPLIVINKLYQKNFLHVAIIFSLFGLLQVILSPITSVGIEDFLLYKTISITLTSLWFILFTTFIVITLFKFKRELNRHYLLESLYEALPVLVCSTIALLFLIFIETNFMDTTAYSMISAYFQNNQLTFGNGIGSSYTKLSGAYAGVAQYFVYASWGDYIPLYQIINPFLTVLIINYLFNQLITANDKFSWVAKVLIISSVTALYTAFAYISTGGNLVMQSMFILFLLALIYKKEYTYIPLSLLYIQFFSSTGALITVVTTIALAFYVLVYCHKKDAIIIWISILLLWQMPFNVFVNLIARSHRSQVISFCFEYLSIFLMLISFIVSYLFIFKKFKLDGSFITWADKGWFNVTLACLAIFNWIVFPIYIFCINKSSHFPNLMVITFIILYLGLIGLMIYDLVKKNGVKEYMSLFTMTTFVSLAILVFINLVPIGNLSNNGSIWRLNYVIPWMGNVPDVICLTLIMLLVIVNDYEFKWKHHPQWKWFNLSLGAIGWICAIISSCMSLSFGTVKEIQFNGDCRVNTHFFTKNDEKLIKSLKINDQTKLFTSTRASSILGKGHNVSGELQAIVFQSYRSSSWVCSTYGIIGGLENVYPFMSTSEQNKIKDLNITKADITNALKQIDAEYFIVNKSEVHLIPTDFNLIANGDNIAIFTK